MKEYQKIYNFNVFDEIMKGETVYLIDRAQCNTNFAITKANDRNTEIVCEAINNNNKENRYEFYKVVEVNE